MVLVSQYSRDNTQGYRDLPSDSGVCAVGDDPGVVLGDHAAVVLVLVDVVDHVSLHSLHRDNISVNLASNVESANSILPH